MSIGRRGQARQLLALLILSSVHSIFMSASSHMENTRLKGSLMVLSSLGDVYLSGVCRQDLMVLCGMHWEYGFCA